MALAQYSKLFWFPSGELARNVPARVFPENSNVLAPLFTDATGATPAPNPISTTAGGLLTFWAEAGQYWIHADSESILVTVGPGGGGTVVPSDTVETETSYAQAPSAGASAAYARGDHTHGTPAAPSVPGPGNSVVAETSFGQASDAGAATTWSRSDHTHGTPAAPGGGGSSIRTARVRITDDNLSGLAAAPAWALITTSGGTVLRCSIAAAVGDRVRAIGRFMRKGAHFLDWVILDAAGLIDEYATTWSATPPPEGDPALYPSLSFGYEPGPPMFTVGAEHINAGLVTVALAHQGAAAGNANLVYAHPTYPFQLRLENIGPEPA